MNVWNAAGRFQLVPDVEARLGSIDTLVNNAGIAVAGDTATDISEEVWDPILTVNDKGVWLGMRAVLPAMIVRVAGKRACRKLLASTVR